MNKNNNQQRGELRTSWFLPVSILVAGVLVAGALVYNVSSNEAVVENDGAEQGGKDLVANVGEITGVLDEAVKGRVILGDSDAPVTLVEYSDFQCPFCGKFYLESGEKLREEYIDTGKAKMIFVDLAFLGPESVKAAQAAHCAGDQGQYWAYHDKLYDYIWDNYYAKGENGENVGAFSGDNLRQFADELKLDNEDFDECLSSDKYAELVESGYNSAQKVLGQRISTPSIFVNGKLIQGAQPYDVFKKAIEEELNK